MRERFHETDISCGSLGENLTTEGLLEEKVRAGGAFEIGSARLAATQPRLRRFKLGIRFGTATVIKSFLES